MQGFLDKNRTINMFFVPQNKLPKGKKTCMHQNMLRHPTTKGRPTQKQDCGKRRCGSEHRGEIITKQG